MDDVKIIIAAHKKYEMPVNDIYVPIHVGGINKESLGYIKDSSGENISEKNNSYCELTDLYYAWKNMHSKYLGLVQYRRYFKGKLKVQINGKKRKILSKNEIIDCLNKYDVILPKKRHYWIETNESQYIHAHHKEGLIECENAIKKLYPEYLDNWHKLLKKRSGHRFNMYIMTKEKSDRYCEWLFSILEEVEKNVDITNWTKSEQRIFGYLAERLLDLYIVQNNYKFKNQSYFFAENQNWFKKIFNFIKRKFGGNKK